MALVVLVVGVGVATGGVEDFGLSPAQTSSTGLFCKSRIWILSSAGFCSSGRGPFPGLWLIMPSTHSPRHLWAVYSPSCSCETSSSLLPSSSLRQPAPQPESEGKQKHIYLFIHSNLLIHSHIYLTSRLLTDSEGGEAVLISELYLHKRHVPLLFLSGQPLLLRQTEQHRVRGARGLPAGTDTFKTLEYL